MNASDHPPNLSDKQVVELVFMFLDDLSNRDSKLYEDVGLITEAAETMKWLIANNFGDYYVEEEDYDS